MGYKTDLCGIDMDNNSVSNKDLTNNPISGIFVEKGGASMGKMEFDKRRCMSAIYAIAKEKGVKIGDPGDSHQQLNARRGRVLLLVQLGQIPRAHVLFFL